MIVEEFTYYGHRVEIYYSPSKRRYSFWVANTPHARTYPTIEAARHSAKIVAGGLKPKEEK